MSISIKDKTTGNLLSVDSSGRASVNFPTTESKAGFASIAAESDSGSITSSRVVRAARANDDYALTVAGSNTLFNWISNSTVNDARTWKQSSSTMTIGFLASDYVHINSGLATAQNNYMIITSYKTFPMFYRQTLYVQFKMAVTNSTATGKIAEAGLGYSATTSAPTDGFFFRWDTDGALKAITVNNSVEQSVTISTGKPADGEFHYYLISITTDEVKFWIDDVVVASITSTNTLNQASRSSAYPLKFRVVNDGNPASAACSLLLSHVIVDCSGAPLERPFSYTMSALGQNANTGGHQSWAAFTTQSNWTNSPTIASGTLTNTAPPSGGYTGTTLGGLFQFAAHVPGATPVNNIIFAYWVPTVTWTNGRPTVQEKCLYITDLAIYAASCSATVTTTATIIQWGLAYGGHNLGASTGYSLAVAEAATTKAPRRVPLGLTSWRVNDTSGTAAEPIVINFTTPIFCMPGSFVHIFEATLVGTATANQVIIGTVMINGFWE